MDNLKYLNSKITLYNNGIIQDLNINNIDYFITDKDTIDSYVIHRLIHKPTWTSTKEPIQIIMTCIYNLETKKEYEVINDFDKNIYDNNLELKSDLLVMNLEILELKINDMIRFHQIEDTKVISRILSFIFNGKLNHYQEFQYYQYSRIFSNMENCLSKSCIESISKAKGLIINGIYKNKKDVFESQFRGVFLVNYFDKGIKLDYLLSECNLPLKRHYIPYKKRLKIDAENLPKQYIINH